MSHDPYAGVPVLTDAVDLPADIDLGDAVQAPAPAAYVAPAIASIETPVTLLDEPRADPRLAEPAHVPLIEPIAASTPPADEAPDIDEDELVSRITADVQKQIDLMFEYRLREALVPTLARISDMLIRETRLELALTLRDVVARAVAQEVARHRAR